MLKRVGVLDDSMEFQQLVSVMLSYIGISNLTQWTTSADALPALTKSPPDLLLLDVMMGGMGGLDVWKQLRNHPTTRELPIIMCTAAVNSIVEDESWLQEDRNTIVLPKPFTLEELRNAMERLLP